ncbi:unnamed protein product [Brugia timori]|uniref:Uncharacterized protein n=1 Tax=Brugia timori TaxID=42155 RepID=A0A0R3QPV4_9BILA|nr:unnamed protein product [Brugia timori]
MKEVKCSNITASNLLTFILSYIYIINLRYKRFACTEMSYKKRYK